MTFWVTAFCDYHLFILLRRTVYCRLSFVCSYNFYCCLICVLWFFISIASFGRKEKKTQFIINKWLCLFVHIIFQGKCDFLRSYGLLFSDIIFVNFFIDHQSKCNKQLIVFVFFFLCFIRSQYALEMFTMMQSIYAYNATQIFYFNHYFDFCILSFDYHIDYSIFTVYKFHLKSRLSFWFKYWAGI